MKTNHLLPLCALSLLVLPLGLSAKPDAPKSDKGPPSGMMDGHKDKAHDHMDKSGDAKDKADEAKKKADAEMDAAKEKADKAKEKGKADLEGKKDDQVRKEEGKGSETGQAKRAEHSRKWWKFWGGDKE